MPYVQSVDGHKYILVPVVQHAFDRPEVLIGAQVYNLQGKYMGFWPKENMLGEIGNRLQRYLDYNAAENLPKKVVIRSTAQLERLRRYE